MATLVAMGQQWSYQFDSPDRLTRVTDGIELGGNFILSTSSYTPLIEPNGVTHLISLDGSGVHLQTRRLWNNTYSGATRTLLQKPDSLWFYAVGELKDSAGEWNYHVYRSNADLEALDSSTVGMPNVVSAFLDNACLSQSGDIVIAGSGRSTEGSVFDVFQLIRLGPDGDSITSNRMQNGFFFVPRHIVELHPDTFLVSSFGAPALPEFANGTSSYLSFGAGLNLLGGFLGVAYDGSDDFPWFPNSLWDQAHMIPLPSGNILVGGHAGSLDAPGMQCLVQKISSTGEHISAFTPRSEFAHDLTALYGNLSRTADGNILFAFMANFQPGPPTPFAPTEPNRLHVYKLDTALNVICANVLDGFPENAFYWLDRIKGTADGGYLLMGSRVDLNQPEVHFEGWVRKFSAEDCYTGLEEQVVSRPVEVYPNPAIDEISFTLNGPSQQALVQLYNVQGRAVGEALFVYGQATAHVGNLASGMYLYRITDRSGKPITSGRWLKQ